MLFNRAVWTDWRLILAIPVAIGIRMVMNAAYTGQIEGDPLTLPNVAAEEERLFDDHSYQPQLGDGDFTPKWRRNLDPLSIALAGGGFVFLAGAFVAMRIWRNGEGEVGDEVPDDSR